MTCEGQKQERGEAATESSDRGGHDYYAEYRQEARSGYPSPFRSRCLRMDTCL